MWNPQNRKSATVVSAIFSDLFSVGSALERLGCVGFDRTDVEVIAVLSGRLPDLSSLFYSMGVSRDQVSYCLECFEDGGALLVVRTRNIIHRQVVLGIVRQHGGIVPPTIN